MAYDEQDVDFYVTALGEDYISVKLRDGRTMSFSDVTLSPEGKFTFTLHTEYTNISLKKASWVLSYILNYMNERAPGKIAS